MVTVNLGNIQFQLRESHDFSWLDAIGRVFCVFAQNDSGNISFGVDDGKEKYFIKVAGLKTIDPAQTPEEAVNLLKRAVILYEKINHPNLIKLVRHGAVGDLYFVVFKWAQGDCLFDHWNFEKYREHPELLPPAARFKQLPASKRLKATEVMFSFLSTVSAQDYVAVDFYDGSIMYDFTNDTTTICDIDLFRKKPAVNDIGKDYWGTKRLKAPEEYSYGAAIDEATNVFTLGALIFTFFGSYTEAEIKQRYQQNAFTPCSPEKWELSQALYHTALKAVSHDRIDRYPTIDAFHTAWLSACSCDMES